jgi:hypothetical protein
MKDKTRVSQNERWNKGQEDWMMELGFHKMKDGIKVKKNKGWI